MVYDVKTFIFHSEVDVRSDAVSDSTDGQIISHSTHSKHDTVRAGKADSRTLQRRRVSDYVRDCTGVTRVGICDVKHMALSKHVTSCKCERKFK